MEGAENHTQEDYDASFMEQPAILDKYKAAAVIVDGKYIVFIKLVTWIIIDDFSMCFFINQIINGGL